MNDKALAAELVMTLFQARTIAHVMHLRTRSYAAHKALNEFYDEVVDVADAFAEAYQGVYGLLEFKPVAIKLPTDSVAFLTGLRGWVDQNRKAVTDRAELQNLIDEIVDLIDSTIYKLRFLE